MSDALPDLLLFFGKPYIDSTLAAEEKSKFTQFERLSGGTLGAAALHIESGQSLHFNASEVFPLASVVKLVNAIAFLKRVDIGDYKLETKIHLTKKDTFPIGHSPLTEKFPDSGLDLNYGDLLRMSICESDTTADAILLARAGGPGAVQKVMDAAGCSSVKVKEPEYQLVLDYSGVKHQAIEWWNQEKIEALIASVPKSEKSSSARRFMLDPKNTSTPQAMIDLLSQLKKGKILNPDTTSYLFSLLEKTSTWPNRIKGQLPKATTVAHKTGTWQTTDGINAATNDVGIITLPNNAGHVCIAVFVKGSPKQMSDRELAIASFAKLAYERWK